MEIEQQIFKLSLIVEGATEKASPFKMPLKSIYNKNIQFWKKNVFFENCIKVKKVKICYN